MSANPVDRYRKLLDALKDPAATPGETDAIRRRIKEMEERYPELRAGPQASPPPTSLLARLEELAAAHILQPAAMAAGAVVTDFIRGASQAAASPPVQEPRMAAQSRDAITAFLVQLRKLAAHPTKMEDYLTQHALNEAAVQAIDTRVGELLERIDPDHDVKWDDLNSVVTAIGTYLRETGRDPDQALMVEVTVQVPLWMCLAIDKPGIAEAPAILSEIIVGTIHDAAFDDEEGEEEEDAEDEDSDE